MTFIPDTSYIPYIVYAVNSLNYVKESILFFCDCIYEGYTKKRLVFAERNTYPILVSSTWSTEELLTYYPDSFTFGAGAKDKVTLDIVTAELNTHCGRQYDLSSFLYSVKWYSSAPSLYELVLLFFLHEKICLSTDTINSYTLHIMTSDAEEHVILMNSVIAKQTFRGFTEGVKSTTEGLKVD